MPKMEEPGRYCKESAKKEFESILKSKKKRAMLL